MLASLLIPLGTGGLFILLTAGTVPASVTAASSLIFYGLAVVSAGKFTFGEIHWLGVLEVLTGLICLVLPQYSIIIWAMGFGSDPHSIRTLHAPQVQGMKTILANFNKAFESRIRLGIMSVLAVSTQHGLHRAERDTGRD